MGEWVGAGKLRWKRGRKDNIGTGAVAAAAATSHGLRNGLDHGQGHIHILLTFNSHFNFLLIDRLAHFRLTYLYSLLQFCTCASYFQMAVEMSCDGPAATHAAD